VSISGISMTGTNAADFGQTNNCGSSLAVGASCTINVTFTPSLVGAETAAVAIADNAGYSPQSVNLNGTGVPVPIAGLSPSTVSFPSQYVGTSGLPQTVTLTNTGSAALTITSVAASPADFGVLSACGSSVAVGSSCSIGVFFDPTATGARIGTLTVTDNAAGSPQTASLSGSGQDFSMSPSSSSSATVTAGQSANYTVAVAPGGGFNQAVQLSCSGAPAQSSCSLSSSSVALNGSSPASVTVTVKTAGASASLVQPAVLPSGSNRLALWLALSGLPGLVLLYRSRNRPARRIREKLYMAALLGVLSAGTWTACGGGNSSSGGNGGGGGTPTGSYTLTVTGTFSSGSANLVHSTKLTLVVQ